MSAVCPEALFAVMTIIEDATGVLQQDCCYHAGVVAMSTRDNACRYSNAMTATMRVSASYAQPYLCDVTCSSYYTLAMQCCPFY